MESKDLGPRHPELGPIKSSEVSPDQLPEIKLQELERQIATEKLRHARMGDRFLEAGYLDKALSRYIQSGDKERLEKIKALFLNKGFFGRAEEAAAALGSQLSVQEYMQLATQCFDKGEIERGYGALEKAGIKLLNVENMPDYFLLSGNLLSSELLMHLGNLHLKRSEWYEARRRYEDARALAAHTKNESAFNLSVIRLKKLGDTCRGKGALFDAFLSYKEAKALEQLRTLSRDCLDQPRSLDYLANWIEEEIMIIEEEIAFKTKPEQSLVGATS